MLRVLSEGELTERAVLVAALLPPLSAGPVELDTELAEHERDAGAGLPEVSNAVVEQVASALAELSSMPRQPPGPQLTPEARRGYIRQSSIVGGIATVLSMISLHWTPWIAVFASPVIVICLTAIAIHALALRQR